MDTLKESTFRKNSCIENGSQIGSDNISNLDQESEVKENKTNGESKDSE